MTVNFNFWFQNLFVCIVVACIETVKQSMACWCAILITHQLLWQNMEAPVSIFQESPLAGEPREILFHIHSIHRYQLRAKYLYPSTLLWQMNVATLNNNLV